MLGAYSVSKTALLGLTKTLSQEIAADNIRVNCVAPGIIKTKFAEPVSMKLYQMILIKFNGTLRT